MPAVPVLWARQSQEPAAASGFPKWVIGTPTLGGHVLLVFPNHQHGTALEVEQPAQEPLPFVMRVLQTVALLTVL